MKTPLRILIVVAVAVAGLVVTALALKSRRLPATPAAPSAGSALAGLRPLRSRVGFFVHLL
jgi:hypothetical protein